MSTAIRISIRFAQILTLALVLVGVAGGATVARAAEIECAEATPWTADTLARSEYLKEHGQKLDRAMMAADLGRINELFVQAIVLLEQAAEEQADSDPPAGLDELNDDLADSYAAAAAAATAAFEAYLAFDQYGMFEAYDDLAVANVAALEAIAIVEQIADACEGQDDNRGSDSGSDRRRDSAGDVEIELSGEVVDEDGGDPLRGAMVLVFNEGIECDEIDFEALADGDADQLLLGIETDRSGEFEVEAEAEVEGEYSAVVFAQDYQWVCLEELTFAEDEDADEFDFGTIELVEVDAD